LGIAVAAKKSIVPHCHHSARFMQRELDKNSANSLSRRCT
jgi:hypothetical protein